MDFAIAATSFALVFPVELPDKTFIATLVLATRFRPAAVWFGVAAAFFVQTLIAVAAGSLLGLLPDVVVSAAAGLLFLIGAVVLWRGADSDDEVATSTLSPQRIQKPTTAWSEAATSFGVLFVAEWGDLSQLLTAGLSARYDDPVSVFAGSWLALATIAGLAILVGRSLVQRVRLATIRRVGAAVCLTLALLSAYDVIRRIF